MFWKFNMIESSDIDALLQKEDITLHELMDEDDVLQECKAHNKKLIDFLVRPENMEEMINLVIQEPPEDVDENMRFKYPNTACELLTSDVSKINDTLAESDDLVKKLYSFIESEKPLNPLLASFFSKVMGLLITKKSQMIFDYLRSQEDFVGSLLYHLGTSAIMDLLLRLITCIDSREIRTAVINWLSEQKIVEKLVGKVISTEDDDMHCNACQSLCDIVRLSRDQMSQLQEKAEPDPLLTAIECQDTISDLISNMLSGERSESCIVNGLSVIQTLLEFRKPGVENGLEQLTNLDAERLSQGVHNVMEAVRPRLKDFSDILLQPPKQHYGAMPTTAGTLDPPLGNTRLQIVRLIATLLSTNTLSTNKELAQLGTMNVLLDLYFRYDWNNFLHTLVEQCVCTVLQNPPFQVEEKSEHPLLIQLMTDCRILQRILDAWEENEQLQTSGRRRGYMGHLTKIANDIVGTLDREDNLGIITQNFEAIPEEYRQKWDTFVSGELAEANKRNTADIIQNHALQSSSEDDDQDIRDIPFQHDTAMQQVFSDYQLQQMTSHFIDQFGFNEAEFAEQEEKIDNPFSERISSIELSTPASEENHPGAVTFEQVCAARVSHMNELNNSDSDEEDIWEDKKVTFTVAVQHTRERIFPTSEDNPGGSDNSSDSEEDLDSPRHIPQQPHSEKMDVDNNEGWANFEHAMETAPVAMDTANPWEAVSATDTRTNDNNWTTTLDNQNSTTSNDMGWADFSKFPDTSSLSNSELNPRCSSPIAMDTTENGEHMSSEVEKNEPVAPVISDNSSSSMSPEAKEKQNIDKDAQSQAKSNVSSVTIISRVNGPDGEPATQTASGSIVTQETMAAVKSTAAEPSFLSSAGLIKAASKSSEVTESSGEQLPSKTAINHELDKSPKIDKELEEMRNQAKEAMENFDKASSVLSQPSPCKPVLPTPTSPAAAATVPTTTTTTTLTPVKIENGPV